MLVHCRVTSSIKSAGTHLYFWAERGTVRVKCLAKEHNENDMSPVKGGTQTTQLRDERTNHQVTAPPNRKSNWTKTFLEIIIEHVYS